MIFVLSGIAAGCADNGDSGDAGLIDSGAPDGGNTGQCPLTPSARLLIAQLVASTFQTTSHVAQFSNDRERGFALQVLGAGEGYIGFASLMTECAGPEIFAPSCESVNRPGGEPVDPFWMTRDRCLRLSCEAAGVALTEVYLTMLPIMAPDQPHVFSYQTEMPSGSAVYDPNPHVVYRIDQTQPMIITVTATLAANLIVTVAGEAPIDLSYSGNVVADKRNGDIQSLSAELTLPNLTSRGPLEISFVARDDGSASGGIDLGSERLAEVVASNTAPVLLEWAPVCR